VYCTEGNIESGETAEARTTSGYESSSLRFGASARMENCCSSGLMSMNLRTTVAADCARNRDSERQYCDAMQLPVRLYVSVCVCVFV
jgi:hypothetical protein